MQGYSNNHQPPQGPRFSVWIPLLLSVFTVAGMLIGYNLQKRPSIVIDGEGASSHPVPRYGRGRVEEVLRYIENKYVDEVNGDELLEKAIDQLLDELDPHSNYIPASELQTVNENLEGNFVGIGIEFDIMDDTIIVLMPTPEGPASEAGVLPGDRIITVGDSLVAGIGIDNKGVADHLRGEEGSPVRIGVRRGGKDELLEFKITRGKIPLHSLDAAAMLDPKTGYVKINRFSSSTYDEFMEACEQLEGQGMEDLVIDLRQNPGGYLKEATRILNQIIPQRDVLLVYTEGEHSTKKTYETKGARRFEYDDVAVLIDEGSASASEILAGALQDWDRAVIVGRRSFGKGLVQEQYDLSDGSALRLTVARYYTKSGRLIQKSYKNAEEYHNDASNRQESGELSHADSIHHSDTTKYYTMNDRVVYGGGGITPDVFVAMNPVNKNKDYIYATTNMPHFVYRLLDKERSHLTEMGEERFIKEYKVSDALYGQFKEYLIKKDKEGNWNAKGLDDIQADVRNRLKQSIAHNVFGSASFFKVRAYTDKAILKTLDIIDNSEKILEEND